MKKSHNINKQNIEIKKMLKKLFVSLFCVYVIPETDFQDLLRLKYSGSPHYTIFLLYAVAAPPLQYYQCFPA